MAFKEIKNGEYQLTIERDFFPEDPRRSQDKITKMVCLHKRYNLGDDIGIVPAMFDSYKEIKKHIERKYDVLLIESLYLLDHSGITISTVPFSNKWDSGQVGFIFIDRQDVLSYFKSWKMITMDRLEMLESHLLGDIQEYDDYLNDNIFRYELKKQEELIDSCSGFFGDDFKSNGLVDYVKQHSVELANKI